ncbi:MAG: hypothetical protein ACD_20C00156G0005 [uncultured bacterium]|nr:MAG: hypothetical protein ACD_20C00156G0005 [uncultured bacterium]HBH18582.1 hypothetical protein [Cyanobacteria bacterium UBA9579]
MKKKITVMALMLILAAPGLSIAATSNNLSQSQDSNIEIAFVQDVIRDMAKNTLYNLGTQMLNKYANPNGYNYNYTPSTPNYNYNNNNSNGVYYDYNANSNNNNYNANNNQYAAPGDFIPGQDPPPEQMIPIS